jgi:HlyD family secretion protein
MRSQRDEAAAHLQQLQSDASRVKRLFDSGLLSRQALEQQETDVRIAEARLKALDGQVVGAQADLDLALANERQVALAQHEVTQTEAQIRQADAQLAQTAARMAYTEVVAPLAGTVSLRVVREGEVVNAGDPIVTIVDLDDVWVSAAVEETYISRVARGDTLDVELISGERLQGTVSFVSPEAEFATQRDVSRSRRDIRTFGIRVTLPNAERRLHAGMTAYVTLPAAASSSSSPAAADR